MTASLNDLRARIEARKWENSTREGVLLVDIDKLHSASTSVLKQGIPCISKMIDDQIDHRHLISNLQSHMQNVSVSATTLSSRVKELDRTLSNLSLAKRFVHALEEMKQVDARISDCISRGDLDGAVKVVKLVHEYRQDGFLTCLSDASIMKKFAESEARVTELVRAQFEESTKRSELKQVTASTKLLFSLGLEKEALLLYTEFVRAAFSEKCMLHAAQVARRGSMDETPVHVESVTNIFLEVADVIQKNQRYIESEFGETHFIPFLSQIEYEANAHAVRVIRALMKATNMAQKESDSEIKIRALDFCLEELVTVIMRCKRFAQYIKSLSQLSDGDNSPTVAAPGSLQQVVEEVAGVYVSSEYVLMSTLVERALREDSVDTDGDSCWSSAVDDCFFIFKKSLERSLLTMDPNCACAIVNHITTTLQMEYKEYLEESFGASKRLFNYCSNVLKQHFEGISSSHHPLRPIFQQRWEELSGGPVTASRISSADSLPHAIGNISLSSMYMIKFRSDCLESFDRHVTGSSKARSMFQQCLGPFDALANEFNEVHVSAVKYMLQQLRGTYITPFISAVDNVNFNIDESGFADMQVNDPYIRAFVASLDSLVRWVRAVCAPESSSLFASLLCDYVGLRFERFILQTKQRFSFLGATQLYQDIARLVSFFAQNTDVPTRTKFGRIQVLCSILCLESLAEFLQMFGEVDSEQLRSFKITATEIRSVLGLRVEFSPNAIGNMLP